MPTPRKKMPVKTCMECGGTFHKKPDRSWAAWEKQKHCSPACSYKNYPVKKLPARRCVICPAPLVQKQGEKTSNFKRRKTCCNSCMRELHAINLRKRWKYRLKQKEHLTKKFMLNPLETRRVETLYAKQGVRYD